MLAYFLGLSSVFALGLLIAAVAPGARTGSALSMLVYFLTMFLGGAYLPRVFLPGFLARIGEYAPPGVQALLDAWMGPGPQPLQLAVLALIALAASAAAARWFRWE
jgi:ABC-2 type transport system permease protein